MRKIVLTICLSWVLTASYALDASISYAPFKTAEFSYLEVYVHVVGSTLTFEQIDSLYQQGKVEVILLFKEEGEILKFDKYVLESPKTIAPINFFDLKRYSLENGTYTLEVSVQDLNNPENAKTYTSTVEVDFSQDRVEQSGIQLLQSYKKAEETNKVVKNGYILEALPFNFYDKSIQYLSFYNEIYQTDQFLEEDFLVTYYIEEVLSNGELQEVLIGHKRKSPEPVCVLLMQVDIQQLPSGNYNFVLEVRNRNKELLSSRKVFFQRSNPYLNLQQETIGESDISESFVARMDQQELRYSLKAIAAVIPQNEADILNAVIQDEENLSAQRLYLFSYWARENPNRPDLAYQEFMKVARAVDRAFKSGFGYGFETDRGYVYMKYGQPDDIVREENDPSAPPYEIWSYNFVELTRQPNVRFIFYNPSLAGGDFRLLHSTVRGELYNPQWEVELYRDAPNEIDGTNFIDGTEMQDNFGRQARRRLRDF